MRMTDPRITASRIGRTCRTGKTYVIGSGKRLFAELHPPHKCACSSHECPNCLNRPTCLTAVVLLSVARVCVSVAPNARVPLPITYGKMVCQRFNAGSGTHSKAWIPARPKRGAQWRLRGRQKVHALRWNDAPSGYWQSQIPVGDNRGWLFFAAQKTICRQPLSATLSIKFAEKCVSIFLEVQGRRPCRGSLRAA